MHNSIQINKKKITISDDWFGLYLCLFSSKANSKTKGNDLAVTIAN